MSVAASAEETLSPLFEPISIGGRTSRNRIVALPHGAGMSPDGVPSLDYANYFGRLAEGSAGMVVLGGTAVHETSRDHTHKTSLYDPAVVPGLARMVERVQGADSLFICQLAHMGRDMVPRSLGVPLWAPSAVPSPVYGIVPAAMTLRDIRSFREGFARSEQHVLESGADGVEVHAGQGYLVHEFLSPWSNRRTDSYGGGLQNRARLLFELLEAAREEARGRIVGLRVSAGELIDGGLTWADVCEVVSLADERKLMDYVTVSVPNRPRDYIKDGAYPPGGMRSTTRELKAEVGCRVIVSQRINTPEVAADVLADGDADMVGLARALIADPDWGAKARAGRSNLIRPCIACLQDCRQGKGKSIACSVNPDFGFGRHDCETVPRTARRRVVVVGGGPAGCNAALAAADQGDRVTLLERSDVLGGRARLAGRAPHRGVWVKYADYLHRLVAERSEIDVRLEQEADATSVLKLEPDLTVVATGARSSSPEWASNVPVLTSDDFLAADGAVEGRHGLIVDTTGSWDGVNCLELVVQRGLKGTYVAIPERVADRVPDESRYDLRDRLAAAEVDIHVGCTAEVGLDSVRVIDPLNGIDLHLEPDFVVYAGTTVSQPELYDDLLDRGCAVTRAGDCITPRGISFACKEGWDAMRFQAAES